MILAALLVVAACEACHGPGGNSVTAGTPSLAGQPELFLANQLVFFREGLRPSPVMGPVTKDMKDADVNAFAKHFSKVPAKVQAVGPPDAKLMKRGTDLVAQMHCGQCHLPDLRGRAQMPRLAAQREDYLVDAMVAYRDNKRTSADTTMAEILRGMPDDDIRALAHFLSRKN